MYDSKRIYSAIAGMLVLCFSAGSHAAVVTYNYLITGDVYNPDSGAYGLNIGDTITAYGTLTADLSVGGDVTVLFGSGSGNTMTIDVNGTLISASADDNYAGGGNPYLTFNAFNLTDFDFFKTSGPSFNSSFMGFDDFGTLYGEWRATVELTQVPVPAAAWLLGSGLLGLAGVARRKAVA